MEFSTKVFASGNFWHKLLVRADAWLERLDWPAPGPQRIGAERGASYDGRGTEASTSEYSGARADTELVGQSPADVQARAIVAQGGAIEVDCSCSSHPVTRVDLFDTAAGDGQLAELQGLERLTTLYLDGTQVTDQGLGYLSHLASLETLFLDRARISDEGLVHLQSLTRLRTLALGGTQVTDAGLARIAHLTELQELYLFSTKISDAGLKHLAGMVNLRWLDIGDTHVTATGREQLQKQLPNVVLFF